MDYVLKTKDLCKQYKDFKALKGLTMNVPKGAIYGFVGRNGAGKTTLIRIICGIQFSTSGSFEQYDIMGIPDYSSIDGLLELVGLKNTGKKLAKNFSLGMRQRLAIAVALCGNPDLLIFDEPINGLDPQGIIEIRELILKLNKERNITILISSHILDELAKLATHYGFIDNGSIVREMSAEELETACRKCVRIKVTDCTAAVKALDDLEFDYKISDENVIDIYAKPNITRLAAALSKLVGGDSNE